MAARRIHAKRYHTQNFPSISVHSFMSLVCLICLCVCMHYVDIYRIGSYMCLDSIHHCSNILVKSGKR